jgi:hypothetical protein
MKTFAARRWRNLAVLAVLCAVVLSLDAIVEVSLRQALFYTGWLMTGLMLVLTVYNLYKKVPFLPLGRSAAWLQLHIYLGLLTILVFGLHAGRSLPFGPLGWILTALFAGAAGSGILGLIISRSYPAHLRARGPEVLFEQIPLLRRHLRDQAEKVVLEAAEQLHSTHVAVFYMQRLKDFFDGPRNFWRHVARFPGYRHTLLTELDAQDRYLDDKERAAMHALRALVKRKDNLDFQYALQAMLKYWLFVHISLTYSLLVFSAFHILVIYAYAGVPW